MVSAGSITDPKRAYVEIEYGMLKITMPKRDDRIAKDKQGTTFCVDPSKIWAVAEEREGEKEWFGTRIFVDKLGATSGILLSGVEYTDLLQLRLQAMAATWIDPKPGPRFAAWQAEQEAAERAAAEKDEKDDDKKDDDG